MKEKLFFSFTILIIILKISETDQEDIECPKNKYLCVNSGICVDNYNKCPTPMNCGNELKKVNQYTCAKTDSFMEIVRCQSNTCWNNKCVDDPNDCPTMPSCPPNFHKCHDNSCVVKLEQCPKYITCPKFIPLRCPNGDCRRNLEDCPSLIRCPDTQPILCNDNSCKATAQECQYAANNTKCSGSSLVRCSDGTCKSSKFLCSTQKTCPLGKVLCHFGVCADSYKQCETFMVKWGDTTCGNSENPKVRCHDGSCQNSINDCPTEVICPVEKPVKCWDNSCKENIFNCPEYQKCNEYDCANGTCSKDQNCGTLITCSWDAPFKCRDNTCKRNPKDCEKVEDCPKDKPILCWDGACVANRVDCLKPTSCSPATPVKCPDNLCRKSVEECKEINGCPVGFIRCQDKTCKRRSADCAQAKCSVNFPHLCFNGNCVKNKEHCENSSGCPFYAPIKCKNSSKCVYNSNECSIEKIPEIGKKICPDGSMIQYDLSCPSENGCPSNKPILCANNECRVSCKLAICPKETPIKCLNGLCMNSESNCPSIYEFGRAEKCKKNNLITCANGLCTKFPEECKPTSSCPKDMKMCKDGSCRFSEEECPTESTCPDEISFRCPNGSCEKSEKNCLNSLGCPKDRNVKCIMNGQCVKSQDECEFFSKKLPLANGCENDYPFKCPSGKCVVDKNDCGEKLCENNLNYCTNSGVCKININECKKSKCTDITCPETGKCVKNYSECKTINYCNYSSPYRCLDGQCRKYPFRFEFYAESQFCSSRIECPSYRPFLCADGSCVEKSSFCRSLNECPEDKKYRCPDRTCVGNIDECSGNRSVSCPATNPILCSNNGNCVKNYFDCFDESCPRTMPIKCVSGICVSSPRECVYKMHIIKEGEPPSNFTSFELITTCDENEVICYDGSCRKNIDDCAVYDGCNNPLLPFKCKSGKCAENEKNCYLDINKNKLKFRELIEFTCDSGKSLCDDGICRKDCPPTNSCGNNFPYLCSNGVCVKDINECAGESKCEIGKPFRCVDGSCRKVPEECFKAKRFETSTDLKLFVFPGIDLKADIIIDDYNDIIGSIQIPSNSFVDPDESPKKQIISIKSIPLKKKRFSKTMKSYKEPARDFINKLFPYGDQNDLLKLEFEYAILSPILEVKYLEKLQIKQNITLKLGFDMHPAAEISEKIQQRICLAFLNFTNSSNWECVKNIGLENNLKENEFQGKIHDEGYYAIAVDLDVIDDSYKKELDWLMKNFKWIVAGGIFGLFLVGLLFFIFGRVWRYRQKYIKTKFDYIEMEKKEATMKEKSTNFKGETVKDTEENMVFTDNICKEKEINKYDEDKNKRNQELDTMQDKYFHKIQILESNNEKLGKELDSVMERYEKLKEYSELLRQGRNLFSENE